MNRIETVLSDVGAEPDQAKTLVRPLRAIIQLRNGLLHSGDPARRLSSNAATLGFRWPPIDWSAAWNQARGHAVAALTHLRMELIRLADEPDPS